MNTATHTYDVFLSHSTKDKAIVHALADRFRTDGLSVWLDAWQIRPGDNILAKIEEGLEHSRVLVLCMSINGIGSEWARLEAGTFRFRDPMNTARRLIPLRLDDAPIMGSLAQFRYIDWFSANREQAYAALLNACRPMALPSALGVPAVEASVQASSERSSSSQGASTTSDNSSSSPEAERDYVALARDGRYEAAASLARKALAAAEGARDKRLTAQWSDRVADAYRAMGFLREASAMYATAWSTAQDALAQFGVQLAGSDAAFPATLIATLEGVDATLLREFERDRTAEPGVLSMNIP